MKPFFEGNNQYTVLPIYVWSLGGFLLTTPKSVSRPFAIIATLVDLTVISLGAIEIAKCSKMGFNETLRPLQTVSGAIQVMIKGLILFHQMKPLRDLMNQSSQFWKIDHFKPKIQADCQNLLSKINLTLKLFFALCFSDAFAFMIGGFRLSRHESRRPVMDFPIPLASHVPEGSSTFLWFAQEFCMIRGVFNIVGADTVFYAIGYEVAVQFKLLAHRVRGFDYSRDEFRDIWRHHDFLLGYCKKLNRLGGELIVVNYVVAILGSCLQLVLAFASDVSTLNKMRGMLFALGNLMEFGLFAFSAQAIQESAVDVGLAVFESQWYLSQNNPKNELTMVMRRAQKGFTFSGHGLVKVNLANYTQILKTALSVYTFLATLGE